jgi:hypothetical protein
MMQRFQTLLTISTCAAAHGECALHAAATAAYAGSGVPSLLVKGDVAPGGAADLSLARRTVRLTGGAYTRPLPTST